MTKADLKTGMRVTFKNGNTGLVVRGTSIGDFITYNNGDWDWLKTWDDSLNYYGCNGENPGQDIVSIKDINNGHNFPNKHHEKIWTRPEPEEMIYLDEMGEVSKSTIKEALKAKFNREA